MDLSIIIVSWNVKELLTKNLKKIFSNNHNISFEVFVVDNDSKDDTAKMVEENFPQVKLIKNNFNAGFAKANNQAIRESKGKYILLLNPDMLVLDNTLDNLVSWMNKNKNAGLVGGHLLNKDGETVFHVRRFPTLFDQLMIVLKVPHILPFVLNKYLIKDFDYEKEAIVDSIRGSFFAIRREVIDEVGYLDEDYFIWFEEVDYCMRIKKTKWDIIYTPEIKCIDYVGKSFSQVKRGKTQQYFRSSMLTYFKKWKPTYQYWILKLFWPVGILLSKIANNKKDV